ncbi:MAG: integrase core domain-containing protein [Acidimicrobiales bacterium]
MGHPAGTQPEPELTERSRAARFLIRDRDTKFTAGFDEVLRADGIKIIKTPVRSPRAIAIAERFVGAARRECLDRLRTFGRRDLEQVLSNYVAHYNEHRPGSSVALEASVGPLVPHQVSMPAQQGAGLMVPPDQPPARGVTERSSLNESRTTRRTGCK